MDCLDPPSGDDEHVLCAPVVVSKKERNRLAREAAGAAGAAVCSKKHCTNVLPDGYTLKTCEVCRANDKRQVENGNKAENSKRRVESGKHAAAQKRYKQTPKGKATDNRQVENGNKAASDKRHKEKNKVSVALTESLRKIVKGQHDFCAATTFAAYGIHVTEAEWRAHFERHFEAWMNWANHGKYLEFMGYKTVWNFGHRIARNWYVHSDPEEVRKCWSFANLFPQDGKENIQENKAYYPPIATLMAMKSVWPKRWNGELPTPELQAALLAELKAGENADLNASDAGSSDEGAYSGEDSAEDSEAEDSAEDLEEEATAAGSAAAD